jgi:hypothetical protein
MSNEARRDDWLADSVLSGFVATFFMTAVIAGAYGLANVLGERSGNLIERWFWALSHNTVTKSTTDEIAIAIALNLVMGIVWACIYGYFVEPRLSGRGWRKGMLFSLLPWLLSIIAFLPILGGGFLGASLKAGPLPVIGNLILHLIYGAVLGSLYSVGVDEWLDDTDDERVNAAAAERGAIIGGLIGAIAGAIIGWLLGPSMSELGGEAMVTLAGALIGAAGGVAVGSFFGMERPLPRDRRSRA